MSNFIPMVKGQPNWHEQYNNDVGQLFSKSDAGYTKPQLDAKFALNTQEHTALGARIDAVRDAVRANMDGPVFFESVGSVRLVRGVYNAEMSCVECTRRA